MSTATQEPTRTRVQGERRPAALWRRGRASRPTRGRPVADVVVELMWNGGTVHADGSSRRVEGFGEELSATVLQQIAWRATSLGRALLVVVREQGEELALTVHPGGCITRPRQA